MSQSLAQLYTHIVFSTKNRENFLRDPSLRANTFAYLASTCQALNSPTLIVGGVADHVHILCMLSRKHTLIDFMKELKRESSKWVKKQDPELKNFYWQGGYGAFSISPSHINALRAYIARQENHHRKETFKEEFRKLLKKYKIDYYERYVWD